MNCSSISLTSGLETGKTSGKRRSFRQAIVRLSYLINKSNREISNLVPRVSSLLYLYSGIHEAVQRFDWLLAILGRNSDLRGVNDLGI